MEHQLTIYNTLDRKKELFVPLHAPHVGMYVCGPTVYGDAHLGHARPAITFDVLFRYLTHSGYKVRYVRNITDVGHLEHDADDGEDKIAKKARLEELEPMEVVQYYLNRYHKAMDALNVLPPSIEPHASGHIIEQIELVSKILEAGYAYESEGSVYFDVAKYNKDYHYGKLSGRNLDDVLNTTRDLDGQNEKRNPADFALWKKAQPEHIMRWPSPWGDGFPGWHAECTAMGRKYLGEHFDIHGGGMDLIFPHHECEIAQSVASQGYDMVWPMSIMMKAFTSRDDAEIKTCIKMLMDTDAGTGFMHESFHKDDATNFTRPWFAWQNTLFGELILKLVNEGKVDLLNSID